MEVGNPTYYLFPENMEYNQMSLGISPAGTRPQRAGVDHGSEVGKVLGVVNMRNPCGDLSSSAAASKKKTKMMEKTKAAINVGTWNEWIMMRVRKLENIKRKMEKGRIS